MVYTRTEKNYETCTVCGLQEHTTTPIQDRHDGDSPDIEESSKNHHNLCRVRYEAVLQGLVPIWNTSLFEKALPIPVGDLSWIPQETAERIRPTLPPHGQEILTAALYGAQRVKTLGSWYAAIREARAAVTDYPTPPEWADVDGDVRGFASLGGGWVQSHAFP